jgi:hypothetical protein
MTKKPQNLSPTWYVVGGLIGVGLGFVAFKLAGLGWAAALIALLVYEGWTLVNKYQNDTISEIIWVFAQRPMVPFIFGAGFVAAIAHGLFPITLAGMYLTAAFGFLMGHFFFQRKD